MKTMLMVVAGALVAGACAASAGPEPTVLRAEKGPLDSLVWMVGSWSGQYDDMYIEEHWSPPRAGMMLGTNRTIAFGRVVHFEFLQIEATSDGIYYRAWPKSQDPASFRLIDAAASRAVFTNPEHDFPTKIVYWRKGDELHARIEGKQSGTDRTDTWTWTRSIVETR